jgi:3-oxoadipate enol-lactonase
MTTGLPTGRLINLRGQQLYVVLDGRKDAPWLVFSNSLATDLHLWDRQIAAFADRWRILRYDYRGHGASAPSIASTCNINLLADDLLALLDALNATRVSHVGVSMGSVAGVAAALQMPEKFASLVICNSRLSSTENSGADLERRAQLALEQGMKALVEPTLKKWFGGSRSPLDNDARGQIAGMIANTRPADFVAYARGMASYQLEERLADLPMPISLLAGTDDSAIHESFLALSARHPKIKCALLDGAGHLPNIQVAPEFNAVLADLLG